MFRTFIFFSRSDKLLATEAMPMLLCAGSIVPASQDDKNERRSLRRFFCLNESPIANSVRRGAMSKPLQLSTASQLTKSFIGA